MNLPQQRAGATLQLGRCELAERESATGLLEHPAEAERPAFKRRVLLGQHRPSDSLSPEKTPASLYPDCGDRHLPRRQDPQPSSPARRIAVECKKHPSGYAASSTSGVNRTELRH